MKEQKNSSLFTWRERIAKYHSTPMISGERAWDSPSRELDLFHDSFFRVRTDGPVSSFLRHSSKRKISHFTTLTFLFINSSFLSFHSRAIESFVHNAVEDENYIHGKKHLLVVISCQMIFIALWKYFFSSSPLSLNKSRRNMVKT